MKTPRENTETLVGRVKQLERDLKTMSNKLKEYEASINSLSGQLVKALQDVKDRDDIITKQRAKIGRLRGKE
jgi:chromosome segregation ATPase